MNQSSEIPSFLHLLPMLALAVDFPYFIKIITKGEKMKKKLLVLLVAASSMLMPNLASAIAIDVGDLQSIPGCRTCLPRLVVDGCASS